MELTRSTQPDFHLAYAEGTLSPFLTPSKEVRLAPGFHRGSYSIKFILRVGVTQILYMTTLLPSLSYHVSRRSLKKEPTIPVKLPVMIAIISGSSPLFPSEPLDKMTPNWDHRDCSHAVTSSSRRETGFQYISCMEHSVYVGANSQLKDLHLRLFIFVLQRNTTIGLYNPLNWRFH